MSHDVKGAQKGPRVQCMLVRLSKVRHYLASTDLFLNPQQLRLVAAFFFHAALSRALFCTGLCPQSLQTTLNVFCTRRLFNFDIYTALTLCLLNLKGHTECDEAFVRCV